MSSPVSSGISTAHINALVAAEILASQYTDYVASLTRTQRTQARLYWHSFHAAASAADIQVQVDDPRYVPPVREFDLAAVEVAYTEALAALTADRVAYTARTAKLLLTYEQRAEHFGWYGTFGGLGVAAIRRWLLSLTPGFADAPKDV